MIILRLPLRGVNDNFLQQSHHFHALLLNFEEVLFICGVENACHGVRATA